MPELKETPTGRGNGYPAGYAVGGPPSTTQPNLELPDPPVASAAAPPAREYQQKDSTLPMQVSQGEILRECDQKLGGQW